MATAKKVYQVVSRDTTKEPHTYEIRGFFSDVERARECGDKLRNYPFPPLTKSVPAKYIILECLTEDYSKIFVCNIGINLSRHRQNLQTFITRGNGAIQRIRISRLNVNI